MSGGRPLLCILLLTLALLSLSMVSAGHPSQGPGRDADDIPRHSLHVSLFPEVGTVNVTQSQLGELTFGGNVTVEKPQGIEEVTVTLEASIPTGWPIHLSPQTIPFINPRTERFSITVEVPPATPVFSTTLTVSAHAESLIWEADEETTAIVRVGQYFKLRIEVGNNTLDGEPDGSVYGTMTVFNDGNGPDSFLIEVENAPSAISSWSFTDSLLLNQDESADVDFTLYVDEDYKVGYDGSVETVTFKVTSMVAKGQGLEYSKTYPVFVIFKGLGEKLEENWPTYVAYGVGISVAIAVPVVLVRRWRGSRDMEEPDEHEEGEVE